MERKPLIELIEEVAARLRSMERERDEAMAKARALETELGRLSSVISEAETQLECLLGNEPWGSPKQHVGESQTSPDEFTGFDEFAPDPKRQATGQ